MEELGVIPLFSPSRSSQSPRVSRPFNPSDPFPQSYLPQYFVCLSCAYAVSQTLFVRSRCFPIPKPDPRPLFCFNFNFSPLGCNVFVPHKHHPQSSSPDGLSLYPPHSVVLAHRHTTPASILPILYTLLFFPLCSFVSSPSRPSSHFV